MRRIFLAAGDPLRREAYLSSWNADVAIRGAREHLPDGCVHVTQTDACLWCCAFKNLKGAHRRNRMSDRLLSPFANSNIRFCCVRAKQHAEILKTSQAEAPGSKRAMSDKTQSMTRAVGRRLHALSVEGRALGTSRQRASTRRSWSVSAFIVVTPVGSTSSRRTPGSADMPRCRRSKTRNSRRVWGAAKFRSRCTHRKTGMHRSASFRSLRCRMLGK